MTHLSVSAEFPVSVTVIFRIIATLAVSPTVVPVTYFEKVTPDTAAAISRR